MDMSYKTAAIAALALADGYRQTGASTADELAELEQCLAGRAVED
jgi:hypothetical protein